jgi:choline monooxygenase
LRAFLNVCRHRGHVVASGSGTRDYFFAPGVDQTWIDELLAFDDQVGQEDRSLVEGVQRGVRSGILGEGRLLSESEQLVAHFQRLCAEALAG